MMMPLRWAVVCIIWWMMKIRQGAGWTIPRPPPLSGLSRDAILQLAQERYLCCNNDTNASQQPMKDKVAVVTGAAGGIGRELCRVIYDLGGTVVALDRDAEGLTNLQQSLTTPPSRGNKTVVVDPRIWILPTRHEDLDSVADSAHQILERYSKIHLLVNNAGMSYSDSDILPGDPRLVSSHGKDLCFTVNYLSHFLLTELLLPRIDGRIVHVTSTFHWKVDGSDLLSTRAYQSDPELPQHERHLQRAYANSKLAQLWYSRVLNRRNYTSVCACPTWAATGIAGDNGREFLRTFAFVVEGCGPGLTSVLNAVFQ